jgi:hypothetical protein
MTEKDYIPAKELFKAAFEKLKARNQSYVNKYGKNSYSRVTDDILKDLADYFNTSETLSEENRKLKTILDIFGVPWSLVKDYPANYLQFFLQGLITEKGRPLQPGQFAIDFIASNYRKHQEMIDYYVSTIEEYRELNKMGMPEMAEKIFLPELKKYLDKNNESLRSQITTDYYAGNINP